MRKLILLWAVLLPCIGYAQSFSVKTLTGVTFETPTSLQFGPDDRLYVSEEMGLIKALTIVRTDSGQYQVIAEEVITAITQIQNHNDDGSLHNVNKRLLTGIFVAGTAANPILFVTSSDYRTSGGSGGVEVYLDTNSGMLSKLTKMGTGWDRLDLVRGIARGEQNHVTNGLVWDSLSNYIYIANGGNTNAGAPSVDFILQSEYALSGAILRVNMNVLDTMPILTDSISGSQYVYDLPTVDDPTRVNVGGQDPNDPFGGNDGLNQAKIVAGGPVEVYSPGYRNPYNVILTQAGRLYTWDNGANKGWGGHPANEGFGTATNDYIIGEPGSTFPGPNDDVVNNRDGLHLITGFGYYGGHPNPIRANPTGAGLYTADSVSAIWRTSVTADPATSLPIDWPPLPLSLANPIEGDFQNPGIDDASLYTQDASTNGLAEYTASNFGGLMKGDLVALTFDGDLQRVKLNSSGTLDSPADVTIIGNGFGSYPVDVTTQGDSCIFPGSIWVTVLQGSKVKVFEPNGFTTCDGLYDATLDDDMDDFSNADEYDNNTDPCNAASKPMDFDGSFIGDFLVSDLNDPDDDDDGINDTNDKFPIDAQNGQATSLPIDYPLLNNDPGFGFFGLGFTGLMVNYQTDYLDLIQDENNSSTEIIAGGAVGLFTQNSVADGLAAKGTNTQKNAFQFGFAVDSNSQPFVAEVKLSGPVFTSPPDNLQFSGFYLGNGDQDNYVKIVIFANYGAPAVFIIRENNGTNAFKKFSIPGVADSSSISLRFRVDPAAGTVQPQIGFNDGPASNLTLPFPLIGPTRNALRKAADAMALGVIASTYDSDPNFNATWENIRIFYDSTAARLTEEQLVESPASDFTPEIYPNPFSSSFSLLLESELARAENYQQARLFDPAGRLVMEKSIASLAQVSFELDSELPTGVYFLELIGVGVESVFPVVKE